MGLIEGLLGHGPDGWGKIDAMIELVGDDMRITSFRIRGPKATNV